MFKCHNCNNSIQIKDSYKNWRLLAFFKTNLTMSQRLFFLPKEFYHIFNNDGGTVVVWSFLGVLAAFVWSALLGGTGLGTGGVWILGFSMGTGHRARVGQFCQSGLVRVSWTPGGLVCFVWWRVSTLWVIWCLSFVFLWALVISFSKNVLLAILYIYIYIWPGW